MDLVSIPSASLAAANSVTKVVAPAVTFDARLLVFVARLVSSAPATIVALDVVCCWSSDGAAAASSTTCGKLRYTSSRTLVKQRVERQYATSVRAKPLSAYR